MTYTPVNLLKWGAMLAWAFTSAILVWHVAAVAGEMTYVTLADGRRQERRLPLVFRLLLPFAPNFRKLWSRPSFEKSVDLAERQLISAGFEGLLSAKEYLALKFPLCPVAGILFGAMLAQLLSLVPSAKDFAPDTATLVLLFGILGWIFPLTWLRGAVKLRHKSILRALPFTLDLLTLSVEAGMDFMNALQRNCESRKIDPLNEELIRMTREIQIGVPRRTALRNLAARVALPDLSSVCNAMAQADELGVGVGAILRIQSEQIRGKRFDRAEKLANEAPVKMLFPLMLFIFPSVVVILLGPILRQTFANLF